MYNTEELTLCTAVQMPGRSVGLIQLLNNTHEMMKVLFLDNFTTYLAKVSTR